MRLIPEYEPVETLQLCFVQAFFNERFHCGNVLCQMIRAAHSHAQVEVFVSRADLPDLRRELEQHQVDSRMLQLRLDSPGRIYLAESAPIFAECDDGDTAGLLFSVPKLHQAAEVEAFGRRLVDHLAVKPVEMNVPFGPAVLAVNEDIVLLSQEAILEADRQATLAFFLEHFPRQTFHLVPSLAGDITHDLDMFLWPIAPKVWIVSEYPDQTPQARSIAPAVEILLAQGHTVNRVPGLEPIIYDDINTVPNYANGVILNHAALVPAYRRPEDEVVQRILRHYGYEVLPVDCCDIILSNAALHCLAKTVPARHRPGRLAGLGQGAGVVCRSRRQAPGCTAPDPGCNGRTQHRLAQGIGLFKALNLGGDAGRLIR